jgi:hypothetical protein
MKMSGLVKTGNLPQSPALGFQTLFNFLIVVDLHEISRHYLPPAYAVVNFGRENVKREIADRRIMSLADSIQKRSAQKRSEQKRPVQKQKEWKGTKL